MPAIDNSAFSEIGLRTQNDVQKATTKSNKSELGQEEFMALMTAQLKNQDPLKPSSDTDFIAQMAQFSSVDSLEKLNKNFESMAQQLTSNQSLQAASMVGKQVLVPSNNTYFNGSNATTGAVSLDTSVQNLKVNISDQNGGFIKTVPLGTQSPGNIDFSWDGKDQYGNQMPAGSYKVSVEGKVGQENLSFNPLIQFGVKSVVLNNDKGTLLNLADGSSVKFDDVRQIQ